MTEDKEATIFDKRPGAYVVAGKLFFKLLDGSVVTCNCIGEPYASQVKDACESGQAKLEAGG